jgi:predicted phosphohydrolase
MRAFFDQRGLGGFEFLHNTCAFYGEYALCGTRGWFLEEEQKPQDAKVLNREVLRLETSLKAAGERPILCFLHYPPLYQGYACPELLRLLREYRVRCCYYGHLHGPTIRRAFNGTSAGTEFFLISADSLAFVPKKICE